MHRPAASNVHESVRARARRAGVGRRDRVSARLPRRLQPRRHRAARQGRQRSTARTRTRSPTASSARRSASSASASTARTGCCIRRSAKAARARASSSACRGTKRSSSSPIGFSGRRRTHGGASILPYSYGGSNGLLTQDNLDAQLWRRFGTSRLARTVCAAPTGAANMALYGKMPSVTYQDYPEARADRAVGRQPVGVRHSSRPVRARGAEARREARRHRSADDAAGAVGRRASRRSSRAPTSPSRWRSTGICSTNGHADEAFLREHTTRRRSAARARASRGRSSAPPSVAGVDAAALERVAELYARELAGARSAAAGASSATATAATRRWRCWRCRRSAASSACAAAATR